MNITRLSRLFYLCGFEFDSGSHTIPPPFNLVGLLFLPTPPLRAAYRFGGVDLEGLGDGVDRLGLAEASLSPCGCKNLGYWIIRKKEEGGREGGRKELRVNDVSSCWCL